MSTPDLFARAAPPPRDERPKPPAEPPRMRGEGVTHRCAVCGAWGSYGFGVAVLQDRPGTWFCGEHKGERG